MRVLSHTCIVAKGESTHDWAVVLKEPGSVPLAILCVEFKHWAALVQSYMVDG